MIKLFLSNIILQAVLVFVALVLFWIRPLVAPAPMDAGEHPAVLYGLVCQLLHSLPRLAVVFAMLLILAEGIYVNVLLANIGLVPQNSLLPSLLYVLAFSVAPTTLTPAILASGFIIVALDQLLLRGSLLTIPSSKVCGATMLISIASLFYQPAILFVVSYLLIAANYRLYNWRDWMVMLLGLAIPYTALLLILYLCETITPWWQTTLSAFQLSAASPHFSTLTWIALSVLCSVFIWSLLLVAGRLSERPAVWQRNATTVILITIGGFLVTIFVPLSSHPAVFPYLALPSAFCTTRLLLAANDTHTGFGRKKNRQLLYNIILILIIIATAVC